MIVFSTRLALRGLLFSALLTVPLVSAGWAEEPAKAGEKAKEAPAAEADKDGWKPLFDGKTLKNWKSTDFGGEGNVAIGEESIIIEMGEPLSGITWDGGPLPKLNYEISLEAKKNQGNDFFCGLTFPYKDSHCSLILGGWGGGVTGLSSIDGFDASENDTTTYHSYEKNKWYKVRVRVTDAEIQAWLDDERIASVETEGKKISLRIEVEVCKPLSISNFATTSEIRNIKIRELKPGEPAVEKKPAADK